MARTSATSHKLAAAGMAVPVVGLGSLPLAGNSIVVDCLVFMPLEDEPVFKHRFERSGLGLGWSANDDNAAASKAGDAIVDDLVTR